MPGTLFLCADDGWESDVVYLYPALVARGMPASFFVHPARMGQRHKLSWSQCDGLDPLVTVCSHGQYPCDARQLGDSELAAFLSQARTELCDHGHLAGSMIFGPPQDAIDARVQSAALGQGYRVIRSNDLWVMAGISEFQMRGVASRHTIASIQKRIDWCAAGPASRGLALVLHRIVESDPVGTQSDLERMNWLLDAIARSPCTLRRLTDYL